MNDYGNIGPLKILTVDARELIEGDIITHKKHMKVVLRSYTNENVKEQALDVESGEEDDDGEFRSPYRINVPMYERFVILRAPLCKKTSASASPAPKKE